MSAVQYVAGNPDVQDVALDLVRDRLAGLGRRLTSRLPRELRVSLSATQPYSTPWNRCDDIASALARWSRCSHEPGVTDVLVNGPNQVFIDRGAGLELTDLRFPGEGDVRRLAQRLAASVGRRLDDAVPFVVARLAERSSGPCSARHFGIPRHLHFTAGACGTKLFGRRLRWLGLIDPPVPRNSCPA